MDTLEVFSYIYISYITFTSKLSRTNEERGKKERKRQRVWSGREKESERVREGEGGER